MTTNAAQHELEVADMAREWAADLHVDLPNLAAKDTVDPKTPSSDSKEPGSGVSGDKTPPPNPGDSLGSNPDGSPDPLANVKPEDLLKHPTLGPQLQSRLDKTIADQVKARTQEALERERPGLKAKLEEDSYREYLEGLTEQERGNLLAQDSQAAAAWGRYQDEKARTPDPATSYATQVAAVATLVNTWNSVVANSDLSPERKAELSPEHYKDKGTSGLISWGEDIVKSIVDRRVEVTIQAEMDTRWEAYKNEQEAKGLQGRRPSLLPPGSTDRGVPNDPKVASTSQMWDNAFDRLEASQKGRS